MRICSLARWCAVADSEDHSLGVLAREDFAAGSHREPGQGRTDGVWGSTRSFGPVCGWALGGVNFQTGAGRPPLQEACKRYPFGQSTSGRKCNQTCSFFRRHSQKTCLLPSRNTHPSGKSCPYLFFWVDGPHLRVRRRLQLLRASPLDLAGRLRLGKGLQPPPRTPDRLDFLDHQNAPRKAFPVHHLLVVHGCPLVVQF